MTDIETLLRSQRPPSPAAAPALEAHVAAQARGEAAYHHGALRALLKLYQLYGDACQSSTEARREYTVLSLLLALRQYPDHSSDYLALSYMIPPAARTAAAPLLDTLQAAADALEAARFGDFWTRLGELQDASSSPPAVADLARRSVPAFQVGILRVLALTYRCAPLAVVARALTGSDSGAGATEVVRTRLQESGVAEGEEAGIVVFRATTDNARRERAFQESVGFEAVARLMGQLAQ